MSESVAVDRPQTVVANVSVVAAQMNEVFSAQRAAFAREMNPSHEARRDRIDRLLRLTETHQDALIHALSADFGQRARQGTDLADILAALSARRHTRRRLRRWVSTP